eukprot:8012191-Pyramimonas_sp.AAC.1
MRDWILEVDRLGEVRPSLQSSAAPRGNAGITHPRTGHRSDAQFLCSFQCRACFFRQVTKDAPRRRIYKPRLL